jgi:hypothetical protein
MILSGKHLSRRTLLRGLGCAIALPVLDSMTPAFAGTTSAAAKAAPCRMAFVYVPNGIMMQHWKPTTEGTAFEMTRLLQPLSAYRENMLVLTGLTQNNGRAPGDGPGDHARAAASYLTAMHPKKTAGADISVGISVDQVAALKVGKATKFASLELACEDGSLVGNCDSGYSCAYSNSISWRGPATPNPPEINPRAVFERLFGVDAAETAPQRQKRLAYDKSILDYVMDDTAKLTGSLGPTDRRKMDEYLSAVREMERRIQVAEKDNRHISPNMEKPDGVPAEYTEHVKLMYDLLATAFQTDMTRVATFMMAREGSTRAYREIGISDGHHPLSHHRNNPDLMEKVAQINRFHVEQFAYFINKLSTTPDGDGTLLDHSVIMYGSGLADGNRHDHNDLPAVLLGKGCGTLRTGRHVQYAAETPMANLHVALLDRMGVQADQLGDSNGELQHLSDLT